MEISKIKEIIKDMKESVYEQFGFESDAIVIHNKTLDELEKRINDYLYELFKDKNQKRINAK